MVSTGEGSLFSRAAARLVLPEHSDTDFCWKSIKLRERYGLPDVLLVLHTPNINSLNASNCYVMFECVAADESCTLQYWVAIISPPKQIHPIAATGKLLKAQEGLHVQLHLHESNSLHYASSYTTTTPHQGHRA